MPFEPGQKKYAGRKAGTKNKMLPAVRLDLLETLREKGFDPVAELIRVNREAWEKYTVSFPDIAPIYLKIAESSAADILPYIFPKVRPAEPTQNSRDLLNALGQAFASLDTQKKLPNGTDDGTNSGT